VADLSLSPSGFVEIIRRKDVLAAFTEEEIFNIIDDLNGELEIRQNRRTNECAGQKN
jgi:hypothetical protein